IPAATGVIVGATHIDQLTHLTDRMELSRRIDDCITRVGSENGYAAYCLVDLDQFRFINNSLGHAAGDALLQQVARLLASMVHWRDTVARMGGDEFGILLDGTT